MKNERKITLSDQRENVRGGPSAVKSKVNSGRYKELMDLGKTITFLHAAVTSQAKGWSPRVDVRCSKRMSSSA